MRPHSLLIAIIALNSAAHAATIEIDYALVSGSSSPDSFILPNPDGPDFTVVPTGTVSTATMTVRFPADDSGIIGNGEIFVTDFDFTGNTNLRFTNGQRAFGQLIVANLAGPLVSDQVADATGNITGLTAYTETVVGLFDTLGGPTTCNGNLNRLGCVGLTAIYGITFPIPELPGDDAPHPITGSSFANLNTPGASTAANSLLFSLPIGGGVDAPLPIDFTWNESARRLVIPESSSALLAAVSLSLLVARRRRK